MSLITTFAEGSWDRGGNALKSQQRQKSGKKERVPDKSEEPT